MPPSPHTFKPPVSVSVLALRNLSSVPFIRLVLRPNPRAKPASPVSRRAKWLEHGVGAQTAFPAVALALLAEQLPAALASLIRPSPPKPPPKSSRAPPPVASLWVFGATPTLEHAKGLLSDVFLVEEQGVWTAASPPLQTHAFTTAIHRAIVLALQSQGALRVANQVVHPSVRLSYSFSVSLSSPPESRIIIRVAVKNSKARRITDQDLSRDPKQPLHVITAPLGTPAVLSPRAPAGDALTESVLNRWREAGMYPSAPSSSPDSDSSVVFVKFENGLEAPFPRAVVLTNEPLLSAEPIKLADASRAALHPKKSTKASSLWKSRKRPRSPSPCSPPVEDADIKSVPAPKPPSCEGEPSQPFTDDAPTAQSINAAIRSLQKNGDKDSLPALHHPLIEAVFPPILAISDPTELAVQNTLKEEPTIVQNSAAAANVGLSIAQQQKNEPVISSVQGMKNEPSTFAINTSNGLDSFPLDGDVSNAPDFLHGGTGMGLTEFSTLDEVAEFFPDGMDDRLQKDESSLVANENPASQPVTENGRGLTDRKVNDADVMQGGKQVAQTAKMEVDSVPVDSSATVLGDTEGQSVAAEKLATMSPTDLVRAALRSFQSPVVQDKPRNPEISDKLNTFFEEDFTERRRARLCTSQRITKARRLSKLYNPQSRFRLLKTSADDDSKGFLRSDQTVNGRSDGVRNRKSLYIPRKKLKAFSRIRQRGEVKDPSFLRRQSRWELSESDDELEPKAKDTLRTPFSSAALLSLDELNHGIEKGDNHSAMVDRSLETDALKLADSVAIDCASACYVLSAERVPTSGSSPALSENSFSQSSLQCVREEDQKPMSAVQMGQLSSKRFPPHPSTKTYVPPMAGSPSARSTSKRDGDIYNLMSLLEMQLFSMNELSLFRGSMNGTLDSKDRVSTDMDTDMVSSATMRRVLLGLPRALETSHVFKTCLESLACGPKLSENALGESCLSETEPNVQTREQNTPGLLGPLSINEYMGNSASVFPLNPPKVCVGYNKEWMETFGGALPTWEKAGFEPYSERKNVEYVAIAPEDIQEDVDVFLRDVSSAYEESSFGTHTLFPFERVAFISNSVIDSLSSDNGSGTGLSEAERAMSEQYQLYVKALCTKLASLTRDNRKNRISAPTNIVAYVISPFERKRTAANVALMRAVSPLVNAVPDAIPSGIGATPPIPNLPAAPWRASSSKGIVSLTVRILPREIVDRNLGDSVDVGRMSDRPLRPQLMKAISFAVFNSIRTKRVRIPSIDSEVASVLSRASLMPDDLMSPMTPDIVTESPGGTSITPVSPLGASAEEAVPNTSQAASQSLHVGHVDQSCALSPSFLYEPAIVLAGVGKHMGQTESRADIVLHLAYTFCEVTSRFVFAWTDQRGELLDVATVPVVRAAMTSSRRKAFWGMWARGQRWRISFVDEVHATVSRLGQMTPGELEDWDWVIGKVMSSKSSLSEKGSDEDNSVSVVRRFPPLQQQKSDDVNDVYTEFSTPATPGVSQPTSTGAASKATPSIDVRMPPVCSVSVVSVCNLETHLFLEESMDVNADRRDFAIVGRERLSRGKNAQATAVLVRYERDGMQALEVNVLRHYGSAGHSEEMSDERSPWDSFDVQTIAHTIVSNFHELRYTASPPCWPAQKWLSMYPVHMDAIRGFEANLRQIHRLGLGAQVVGSR